MAVVESSQWPQKPARAIPSHNPAKRRRGGLRHCLSEVLPKETTQTIPVGFCPDFFSSVGLGGTPNYHLPRKKKDLLHCTGHRLGAQFPKSIRGVARQAGLRCQESGIKHEQRWKTQGGRRKHEDRRAVVRPDIEVSVAVPNSSHGKAHVVRP